MYVGNITRAIESPKKGSELFLEAINALQRLLALALDQPNAYVSTGRGITWTRANVVPLRRSPAVLPKQDLELQCFRGGGTRFA